MRGGLAVAGTGIAAALCCLAIPLTVGIVGLSDLVALGANAAIVTVAAVAVILVSIVRNRSRGGDDASGGTDG